MQLHPYANIAWKVCSLLYKASSFIQTVLKTFKHLDKAVQDQKLTDNKLLNLFQSVNQTFAFAKDLQELRDKIKTLEDAISQILKQTTECAFFVQDYVRRGFYGMLSIFRVQ